MGQIGQRLEQARISRGMTLEQVSEITKIRLKYLAALEAEDWDVLPGEVYLRGFLRTYAQLVGLDPAELLELYRPTPPPQQEPIPVPTANARPRLPRVDHPAPKASGRLAGSYGRLDHRASRRRARRLVAVAVVLLIIAPLAYLGFRLWRPAMAVTPPTQTAANADTPNPEPTASGTNLGEQVKQPLANTTPTSSTPAPQLTKLSETMFEVRYRITAPSPLELKVGIAPAAPGEPVYECWIDVQSDDRNVGDTMLRSGQTKEYSASDTIRLRLGNPQVKGLSMSINGVEVPRPQTTEPVNLIITRQTQ